jgi:hypothetical protein
MRVVETKIDLSIPLGIFFRFPETGFVLWTLMGRIL